MLPILPQPMAREWKSRFHGVTAASRMTYGFQPLLARHNEDGMLNSEQGFTIIESLITMAIVGIVLTGIHNLAISSSQLYVAQNAVVQMQADGRAAMEFMAR